MNAYRVRLRSPSLIFLFKIISLEVRRLFEIFDGVLKLQSKMCVSKLCFEFVFFCFLLYTWYSSKKLWLKKTTLDWKKRDRARER